MQRKAMIKKIFGTLIICLVFHSCLAQKNGMPRPDTPRPNVPPPKGDIPEQIGEGFYKDKIRIYNTSDSSKSILLGLNEDFNDYILDENEVWLSPSFNFNPVVKIRTNEEIISYTLVLGNFYVLYWNEENQYWDFEKKR